MAKKRWACLRKEYILTFVAIQMLEIVLIVNLKSIHVIDHIDERGAIGNQMGRHGSARDDAGNCTVKRTYQSFNSDQKQR